MQFVTRLTRVLCYLSAVPIVISAQQNVADSPKEITSQRMAPLTADVRSVGMGGLRVAQINGSSSIFSNPAGLAALDHSSVELGGFTRLGTARSEFYETDPVSRPEYSSYYKPTLAPTHAAIAIPIGIQYVQFGMALGVGYHVVYDFNYTRKQAWVSSGTETELIIKNRGLLQQLSPALSLKFGKATHVGISFDLGLPSWVSQEITIEPTGTSDKITFTGSTRPGVTAGLMIIPSEALSLGLSIVSPTKWELSEDTDTEGNIDPVDLPFRFSLGGMYQINEQLRAGAEFQTRLFSQVDRAEKTLDNGFSARLGGEYLLEALDLRFGARLESYPLPDAQINLSDAEESSTKPNLAVGLSVGAGLKPTDALALDAALSWDRVARDETVAGQTFTYSENLFRLDLSVSLQFAGINMSREEVYDDEESLPPPIEIPGR